MRLIFDECLPRRLTRLFPGHDTITVPRAGWSGIKNGELLALIEGVYDVFLTADRKLPHQQQIGTLSFGIVVFRAASNTFEALEPLASRALAALEHIRPGQVVEIGPAT